MFSGRNGWSRSSGPMWAMLNRERAKDCPEGLSFQSFTVHASLFDNRKQRRNFVFLCVHGPEGEGLPGWLPRGRWPSRLGRRTEANLESAAQPGDTTLLIAAVDSKQNQALPSPFIENDSGGAGWKPQVLPRIRPCRLRCLRQAGLGFEPDRQISVTHGGAGSSIFEAEAVPVYPATRPAAGGIFLRVGVHDAVSQKLGTLEVPLNRT